MYNHIHIHINMRIHIYIRTYTCTHIHTHAQQMHIQTTQISALSMHPVSKFERVRVFAWLKSTLELPYMPRPVPEVDSKVFAP